MLPSLGALPCIPRPKWPHLQAQKAETPGRALTKAVARAKGASCCLVPSLPAAAAATAAAGAAAANVTREEMCGEYATGNTCEYTVKKGDSMWKVSGGRSACFQRAGFGVGSRPAASARKGARATG